MRRLDIVIVSTVKLSDGMSDDTNLIDFLHVGFLTESLFKGTPKKFVFSVSTSAFEAFTENETIASRDIRMTFIIV